MYHVITVSAIMDEVDPIGPNDEVFVLIKRKDKVGRDIAREQYEGHVLEDISTIEPKTPNRYKSPADLIVNAEPVEGGVKVDASYAERLRNAPDIVVEYPED